MILKQDECKKALENLRMLEREDNLKKWNQVAPQINCDIIECLIKEHFDNPPLEIEDMRTGWVWDNSCKSWIHIRSVDFERKKLDIFLVNMGRISYYDTIEYERNRFYKKQVKNIV